MTRHFDAKTKIRSEPLSSLRIFFAVFSIGRDAEASKSAVFFETLA